jgi:DNA-binding transcriptional LysR family regulator
LAKYESVTLRRCLQENVFFGKDLPISLTGGAKQFGPGDLAEGNLTTTIESSYSPIRLGQGIVILPASACRSYAAGLCYIPISNPELSYHAVLVYKKDAVLSRAARTYAEIVQDIGQENGLC